MKGFWITLLCAVLLLTVAPAARADDTSGLKITLDPQATGSTTLSGKLTNVPSGVNRVAVTLKVNANLQQFQITDSSNSYAFSFKDVTTWQSLSALPVAAPGRGRLATVTLTSTGDTSTATATSSSLPVYGGGMGGPGGMGMGGGPGYGMGGPGGYGYGYGGPWGGPWGGYGYGSGGYGNGGSYCGYGLAYNYTQPGAYGYPYGLNSISGYYLAPYYRFYQPNPNWMYLPYASYSYSPYGGGC